MMNLIKSAVVALLLSQMVLANAASLDRPARATWPDEMETALEVVQYLIEPFGYRVVDNTKASKTLSMIQPHLVRDPHYVDQVEDLILRIIPSDIGVKIDEQNKLIQFHFVDEMIGGD